MIIIFFLELFFHNLLFVLVFNFFTDKVDICFGCFRNNCIKTKYIDRIINNIKIMH